MIEAAFVAEIAGAIGAVGAVLAGVARLIRNHYAAQESERQEARNQIFSAITDLREENSEQHAEALRHREQSEARLVKKIDKIERTTERNSEILSDVRERVARVEGVQAATQDM